MDEARLTDARGKLIDFSNTIIIATTNVGTRKLIAGKKDPLSEIENHYLPEFLNRLDVIKQEETFEPEIAKNIEFKIIWKCG